MKKLRIKILMAVLTLGWRLDRVFEYLQFKIGRVQSKLRVWLVETEEEEAYRHEQITPEEIDEIRY